MPKIPLGAWLPDLADGGHGGLEEALNVLPRADGYDAMPDAQTFGTSVTASAVLSALSVRDTAGNGYSFAGTNDHLYKQSATGAWDNADRTASYGSGVFRFAGYGSTLLAVNGVDAMQVWTLGTSSRFRDQSASASAPIAACIATVQNFVVAGRLSTAFNALQWSHIDNPLRFGRSAVNQSDSQVLAGEGGNIVGMTGGDYGVILTDRSVWRMSYLGSPLVFRFDELAPNTGCIASGSIARYQNFTFFLSGSGFMAFDGAQAMPIGEEQVDDWFFSHADTGQYERMSAAIDPNRKLYVVSFTSTSSTTGSPDRLLIYNFESRRWTNATQALDVLFQGIARGAYTLEQLDAFGTLDTLPRSLDSDFWGGSKQNVLAGFNTSHLFLTLDAATSRAGTLITAETQLFDGNRGLVTELRPLVQGNAATAITACMGVRDMATQSVSYGAAVAVNAAGYCPLRANGRYHRARLEIAGGFTRAHAFELRAAKVGRR